MKILKKTAAMLLACILLCAMSTTAFAHEVPDLSKTGAISLTFEYKGKAVPGGTVTAYRVGDVAENDGNYDFALSQQFAGSNADLSNLSAAGLAQTLADYAKAQNLSGTSVTIGNDGKAKFSDLKLGLYLIVQTKAADGYEPVSPFLVTVPMNENGVYVYDVDATPKMETITESPDEPDPTPTPTPDPTLPQTGQLNWPVPVLAVLGLCLFLFGWALRYGAKKERHET